MSERLRSNDPAFWMLERGMNEAMGLTPDTGWVTKTHPEIFRDDCYICNDPEFALMGLPVCKPCPTVVDGVVCGAHVAADDEDCDNGHSLYEYYKENYDA